MKIFDIIPGQGQLHQSYPSERPSHPQEES